MIGHGDNSQSAYVWDMETIVDGKPKRLSVPAVDAREWHARDPERYRLEDSAIIFNLDPDGGGGPEKLILPVEKAEALLAGDPGRYRREDPRDALLKALEFEGNQ